MDIAIADVAPDTLIELADDDLLWLHEKVHQAANLDRDKLVTDHLLIIQEIAKRGLDHDGGTNFDQETAAFAVSTLGLTAAELQILKVEKQATTIQTLILSKEVFKSLDAAKKWIKDHDFKTTHQGKGPDETETSYRFRQRDPGDFITGSFRTIQFQGTKGVQAVIGRLKEKAEKQAVPSADASNEEKRKAQKARAKSFGIEALENKGERLSFPKDGPTKLSEYGDPTNLKFFLDTPGRARNGRVRFKQFADTYSKDKSKAIVHERIVRAELKHKIKPSFDKDDPLDMLLPKALRDRLSKSTHKVCQDGCSSCGVCSCASEGEEHTVTLLPVDKADDEQQIVFGIALEPGEVDSQNDTIKPPVIKVAAHNWLAKYQDRGVQHNKIVNSKIEIYESYIAPVNLTIGGQKVKKGSWLLMYHILDKDLWEDIKKGKFRGFSIGGFARRNKV